MKKAILLTLLGIICQVLVFAQQELLVHSSEKGLFLNHTIVAKENFFSVGRLYHVTPNEIAAFNGLDMNKGLAIGQVLKIPLSAANFSQSSSNGKAVYYQVGQKEGLYRVSVKNNNVLMANLRKWNRLSNDNISAGQKLVVGYLVSDGSDQSAIVHTEPAKKPPVVEEVKKEVSEPPVEKKEEVKKTEPAPKPVNNTTASTTSFSVGSGPGYFKPQFDQQVRNNPAKNDATASAGIFKTSSGWQDAKYYALIDQVEPGTIIKIINPTNNKMIYAKVLGQMSGIRQNQGYDVRISNAAATALDVADTEKFIVRVNY